MHEIFFCLLAFSLAAARLEIGRRGRSGWPSSMRIGLAVCVHDAEIVFRMLIKIFSRDPVAACCRLTRERNVAFEHLVRVTTDLYVRSIAVKSLDPMRHPRTIMMRVVAVVATARAFVWSWSHDTCLIAVDINRTFVRKGIPLALSSGFRWVSPLRVAIPEPWSVVSLDGTEAHSNLFLPSLATRRGARDNAPSDTGQIVLDTVHDQTVVLDYRSDGIRLTGPDFGGQDPVRGKERRYSFGYFPVRPQTVFPSIESPPRVMTGDLTREPRDCFAADVGGIRENGLKPPRQRSRPITDEKARPTAKAEQGGVVSRSPHRALGEIDANSGRRREFGEEREQEATRTSA